MEQEYYTKKRKAHKHILLVDRIKIEGLLRAKLDLAAIAEVIGCTEKTLAREIARGTWLRRDSETWKDVPTYSYDVAERRHLERAKNKGRYAKINDYPELRSFLEDKIALGKYSPEAALKAAQEEGYAIPISVKSLYNAIDREEIKLKRADLPRGRALRRAAQQPKPPAKCLDCERIDNRPKEANERSQFGHWEMDLIVSCRGGKHALLTLTERMLRKELIIRLPNKTQRAVKRALDRLERRYGKGFRERFKTITVDNGSEFLDYRSLEQSCRSDEKRFKMYFAHPYSSWERGSNENANGMIRRFFPKGTDFGRVSMAKIQAVEDWMNAYPRKILGWQSADQAAAAMGF